MKKITTHGIDEYSEILSDANVHTIAEYPSAVFCFATHPILGEIVGVSTVGESFLLTKGA